MQSNSLSTTRTPAKLSDYPIDNTKELDLDGVFVGRSTIYVNFPQNKQKKFFVNFDFTVMQLKKVIENLERVNVQHQILIYQVISLIL